MLLLAHMDTVHAIGAFGTEILTEDENFFYGPGVFDCKGGIVIALYVMKTLAETGYRPSAEWVSGEVTIAVPKREH